VSTNRGRFAVTPRSEISTEATDTHTYMFLCSHAPPTGTELAGVCNHTPKFTLSDGLSDLTPANPISFSDSPLTFVTPTASIESSISRTVCSLSHPQILKDARRVNHRCWSNGFR
jgi:hypothetical protein